MKETKLHQLDKIEIVNQVQAKKKHELIGTLQPYTSHTLYEFNKLTKELKKATFKTINMILNGNTKNITSNENKTIIIKENCFYISSLNPKNASKKIHKQLNVAYVIDATNE